MSNPSSNAHESVVGSVIDELLDTGKGVAARQEVNLLKSRFNTLHANFKSLAGQLNDVQAGHKRLSAAIEDLKAATRRDINPDREREAHTLALTSAQAVNELSELVKDLTQRVEAVEAAVTEPARPEPGPADRVDALASSVESLVKELGAAVRAVTASAHATTPAVTVRANKVATSPWFPPAPPAPLKLDGPRNAGVRVRDVAVESDLGDDEEILIHRYAAMKGPHQPFMKDPSTRRSISQTLRFACAATGQKRTNWQKKTLWKVRDLRAVSKFVAEGGKFGERASQNFLPYFMEANGLAPEEDEGPRHTRDDAPGDKLFALAEWSKMGGGSASALDTPARRTTASKRLREAYKYGRFNSSVPCDRQNPRYPAAHLRFYEKWLSESGESATTLEFLMAFARAFPAE